MMREWRKYYFPWTFENMSSEHELNPEKFLKWARTRYDQQICDTALPRLLPRQKWPRMSGVSENSKPYNNNNAEIVV